MKVLLVHNRYRIPGGEERHIDLIEMSLAARGIAVERFESDSTLLDRSRAARLRAAANLTYSRGAEHEFARFLASSRPDVVHVHNIWPLLTPAVLHAASKSGAAVVMTMHNYRFACPAGTLLRNGHVHEDCIDGSSLLCGLRNARGQRGESLAYGIAIELQRRLRLLDRWVDRFVAPSEFVRGMMVRAGLPEKRISVVRHGVPIDHEHTPAISGESFFYAGRLAPEKGVEVLLAAARLAPDLPVAVAGSGPLESWLRAEAPPSLAVLGPVARSELVVLRRRCLMAVQPSVCYEVSPLASMEALADGRGVIASRIGGLPELVEDGVTGLLVEPGDPIALADAMKTVWSNPERAREFGINARGRAEQEFAVDGQTERLVGVYEDALRGSAEPWAKRTRKNGGRVRQA
jgi:glycosyltransferase involved in cell wall biosynthesis